mgnify:CR=1 FL=1
MFARSFFVLFSLSAAFGQTEFFPLHVGNQWVYRGEGRIASGPVVVDIPRSEMINNREYYLVRNLGESDAWLRMEDDGTLYALDRTSGTESVWAGFGTPEGREYRTAINPCNQTARVESRNGTVRTPAAEFVNVLEVSYPAANCADAGLTRDWFVPYIGLVQRESLTIAGPRYLKLAYSRVGGVTVLSEPELGVSLTLDSRAPEGDTLVARLTVRSTQSKPLTLDFTSSQRYDFEIRNSAGEVVYRWSASRAFLQALGSEEIVGERNWVEELPLTVGGRRLPAGRYMVEGWLTARPESGAFRATLGFEIR